MDQDTSGPSMNILIKLMSIVSLVIAPFIAGKTFGEPAKKAGQCTEMSAHCDKEGKCDMSKCATLTKEQCAAMCDSLGCSAEEKAMCMAHFDKDGNWIGGECKEEKECCQGKPKKHEGCSGEAVCEEDNDVPCSKGDECCKNKKK